MSIQGDLQDHWTREEVVESKDKDVNDRDI